MKIMKSQQFRNTKTGQIVTQVPICEIADYEQVEVLDMTTFFAYLNPELPHAERFDAERVLALGEVEITKEVYWHFLEVLPPAFFAGNTFVMCEALTDHPDGRVISSSFSEVGDHYYHRYVAIERTAWNREVG